MRFLYFIANFFLTQQFSFYSSLRSHRLQCAPYVAEKSLAYLGNFSGTRGRPNITCELLEILA